MAILGIQFVVTFTIALFYQKLSPFYSFARWLMCRGLYRYLHPSNEELKTLLGKKEKITKQKGKRLLENLLKGFVLYLCSLCGRSYSFFLMISWIVYE